METTSRTGRSLVVQTRPPRGSNLDLLPVGAPGEAFPHRSNRRWSPSRYTLPWRQRLAEPRAVPRGNGAHRRRHPDQVDEAAADLPAPLRLATLTVRIQ